MILFFMIYYKIGHRQSHTGFIVSPNNYKAGTFYLTTPVRTFVDGCLIFQ